MTLEERFKVYDSFLPQDEYDNLVYGLCDPLKIKWTWQSSNPGDPIFMISHVDKDPFYSTHLLSYIQSCFDQPVEPVRIYYNGQSPNVHGCYHEDDGDVTAILYIHTCSYDPTWGGWTELWDRNTGEHYMVDPLDNRLLLFDSKLTHRGIAFLNHTDPIRTNLTYKLRFTS